jgi:hypothetical protein
VFDGVEMGAPMKGQDELVPKHSSYSVVKHMSEVVLLACSEDFGTVDCRQAVRGIEGVQDRDRFWKDGRQLVMHHVDLALVASARRGLRII